MTPLNYLDSTLPKVNEAIAKAIAVVNADHLRLADIPLEAGRYQRSRLELSKHATVLNKERTGILVQAGMSIAIGVEPKAVLETMQAEAIASLSRVCTRIPQKEPARHFLEAELKLLRDALLQPSFQNNVMPAVFALHFTPRLFRVLGGLPAF
jgi:hypothetical protein